MGLRPGHCYSTTKDRANTRHAVRVQKRDYIGAVPGLKTRQWNMGDGVKKFNTILDLLVKCGNKGVQIRDNALESARLTINRALIKDPGREGFFLKLRIFPHHILRENKQAQGAHADRIQTGMSHAFGQSMGRAARVRNGQKIFSVIVFEEDMEAAKDALLRAASRFPCGVRVISGKDVESIGTKPKKIRDLAQEEEDKKKEEAEAREAEEGKEEKAEGEEGTEKKEDGKEEKDAKTEEKK